jgi:ABC-2 type transport system ATP-binding protein
MSLAIEAVGLVKTYGATRALDGLDLHAEAGTVVGVLGPNGAGKTTAVRVLTTLTEPTAGRATVGGHDVVTAAGAVRRRIGLTGQNASLDECLTGRQNLEMVGQLARLARRTARDRAGALLEQFALTHAADRPVKTYSGGMRRRLDLAASLIAQPSVLFLDEPTTGLDPPSRSRMWDTIRGLVDVGTTVLLTTQYLDEADQLADRIVVVDGGRAIAEGTAAELKRRLGGECLDITVHDTATLDRAADLLAHHGSGPVQRDHAEARLSLPVTPGEAGLVSTIVGRLADAGVLVDAIEVRRPSLDDVFLELTGHRAAPPTTDDEDEEVAA